MPLRERATCRVPRGQPGSCAVSRRPAAHPAWRPATIERPRARSPRPPAGETLEGPSRRTAAKSTGKRRPPWGAVPACAPRSPTRLLWHNSETNYGGVADAQKRGGGPFAAFGYNGNSRLCRNRFAGLPIFRSHLI